MQTPQAWCKLSNGNWALGKVLSTSGSESVISLLEGKVSLLLLPLKIWCHCSYQYIYTAASASCLFDTPTELILLSGSWFGSLYLLLNTSTGHWPRLDVGYLKF